MELYIDEELISDRPKVMDLENALAAVKALKGKKDLCLQESDDGPQVILSVFKGPPDGYIVEYLLKDKSEMVLTPSWKNAADCARRFLAGRRPFPDDLPEDDCPLCKAGL